jgi:hypothetical protein
MTLPEPHPPIEYATKADLRELRQEMRADFAEFRLEFAEFKVTLLEQIRALETSQAQRDSALHKTIITTLIATTAIFGGLVTILKLFG